MSETDRQFDFETLKKIYTSRKQFAIHTDVAVMIENQTKMLENSLEVKLTYSDYLYALIKSVRESEYHNIIADTLFHKALRLNITKVKTDDELFDLIFKLNKNREFIIEISKFVDAVRNANTVESLIEYSEQILELIEKYEKVLLKDFKTATVSLLKSAYNKHTDAFTHVRTLAELKKALSAFIKQKKDGAEEEDKNDDVLLLISDETLLQLIKETESSELDDESKQKLIRTLEELKK